MDVKNCFQIMTMDAFEVSLTLNDLYSNKLTCFSSLRFKLLDFEESSSLNSVGSENIAGFFSITSTKLENDSNFLQVKKEPQASMHFASLPNNLKRPLPSNQKTIKNIQPAKRKTFEQSANPGNSNSPNETAVAKKQLWASCVLDNVKMFMCALCAYKTKNNSDIHRHCRTKHPETLPQYRCSSCDFSTADKLKLKNHYMKSHNLAEIIAAAAVEATPIS